MKKEEFDTVRINEHKFSLHKTLFSAARNCITEVYRTNGTSRRTVAINIKVILGRKVETQSTILRRIKSRHLLFQAPHGGLLLIISELGNN